VKIRWRRQAETDLDGILAYLAERNPSAALDIAQSLVLAADSLATFPNRGRPGKIPGTRELAAVHPYLLVYEVDADADMVRILRVWHGARDRG
jgi:addiction module RelE/StbE family toxin